MKKAAFAFILTVFLPSIFLGILALRTAREQQVILEKQAAILKQSSVNNLAGEIRTLFLEKHSVFEKAVRTLQETHDPYLLAENFPRYLKEVYPSLGVPFAVSSSGAILFPSRSSDPKEKEFLERNEAFLENQTTEEVYQAALEKESPSVTVNSRLESYDRSNIQASPQKSVSSSKTPLRKVQPRQSLSSEKSSKEIPSQISPFSGIFDQIIKEQSSGILSRLVQGELEIWFWTRSLQEPELIFGIKYVPDDFKTALKPFFHSPNLNLSTDFYALLNDRAEPFLDSSAETESFTFNWRKPFVASEVGEILPYWEVALYLKNPELLSYSANTIRLTLISLITLSLGTIGLGSYFIIQETRKQINLAKKKSDFVSNVSHELKTPLTSIRMFAELLHQTPPQESEKTSRFLGIIVSETERLTRLINNILDFAKIERNQKSYHKKKLDFYQLLKKIWETQELQLKNQGFQTSWEIKTNPPYFIYGDEDALTQVVMNLLSNAEKYSPHDKALNMITERKENVLFISVLDRGLGVPKDKETKIFEYFYRADNSLSSGIPGTGLGLTIAKKIVEEYQGTLTYHARPGGGSNFTIKLPIQK